MGILRAYGKFGARIPKDTYAGTTTAEEEVLFSDKKTITTRNNTSIVCAVEAFFIAMAIISGTAIIMATDTAYAATSSVPTITTENPIEPPYKKNLSDEKHDSTWNDNVAHTISAKIDEVKAQEAEKERARLELEALRAEVSEYLDVSDWSREKLDYVIEWGRRNNAYLSCTAMDGTGYWIAASAYDYDMDPRLCAAVATVESGCGAAPYGCQYNVWGWICGTPSMSSWEDGIDKWNAYFSAYFGGERYPISSMHGYGGYGPGNVNSIMSQI